MPRLGDQSVPRDNQPFANAYSSSRQLSFPTILMLLVAAFILKNILFHVCAKCNRSLFNCVSNEKLLSYPNQIDK